MGFMDHIRFGGVEVVNHERLHTYVSNGIRPAAAQVTIPHCEGLAEVLDAPGWQPYTTPMGDEAPWHDPDDPDTWDFAGVLMLELTGLDGTTRAVEVTQTLRGDGRPGRALRSPQTFAATALLMGRTTEGVQAGLAWLRRVLHGACDAAEAPCGPSAVLETLTACPTPVVGVADMDTPTNVTLWHPHHMPGEGEGAPVWGALTEWVVTNGRFDTDSGEDSTVLSPYDTDPPLVDAGTLDTDPEDTYDGGEAGGDPPLVDAGTASVTGEAFLGAGRQECTTAPTTMTWTMRGLDPEGTVVELVMFGEDGLPHERGPKVTVTDSLDTYAWEMPFGVDSDTWRPGLITHRPILVQSLVVDSYASANPQDCVAPYRRLVPVTVTASGPTPVDVVDADCAELLTVEWVWVSGSPYRYSVTTPVLLGLGWDTVPTLTAPGVTYEAHEGETDPLDPSAYDCGPVVPFGSCGIDPAAPSLGTPPTVPVVEDTTRPRITTQPVREVWALIGPEQVPTAEGVLTIDLQASVAPIVGARVRVWDDPDVAGVVPDPCSFAWEWLIDYIPTNGVLTIDGTSGQITTQCEGLPLPVDTSSMVRGDFGGPVKEPVVRCDRRYKVLVQWLDEYPRTAAGYYTAGQTEGDLLVNLYVTPREG